MAKHFQVLVIGGGNAGLSAAALLLLKNGKLKVGIVTVSYTHLTLPTSDLVYISVVAVTLKKKYIKKNTDKATKQTQISKQQ